jgi:hypothetical protein
VIALRAALVRALGAWLALAPLLACAPAEPGPAEVAGDFWAALRDGDPAAARAAALAPEPGRLEALAERPLAALELGAVLEGEARAVVETSLPGEREPVVFYTHLVRTEAGWRVDAGRTAGELRRAELAGAYANAGEALRESGRALGDALERSAREASEALRRALEEIEEALEAQEPPAGREL